MGVDDGFEALYRVAYAQLAAQLFAYLGDAGEAEDIAQESFLRAWQRWDTIRAFEDPASWVRRVAWNLATSRWRRVRAATRAKFRLSPPVETGPVPVDHVAVVTALHLVPENHRKVLVLHYIADLSIADIVGQLGVPRGTVLSWLHRGRRELATHLDERAEGRTGPPTSGDDECRRVESGAS